MLDMDAWKSSDGRLTFNITEAISCSTNNIIFLANCQKCGMSTITSSKVNLMEKWRSWTSKLSQSKTKGLGDLVYHMKDCGPGNLLILPCMTFDEAKEANRITKFCRSILSSNYKELNNIIKNNKDIKIENKYGDCLLRKVEVSVNNLNINLTENLEVDLPNLYDGGPHYSILTNTTNKVIMIDERMVNDLRMQVIQQQKEIENQRKIIEQQREEMGKLKLNNNIFTWNIKEAGTLVFTPNSQTQRNNNITLVNQNNSEDTTDTSDEEVEFMQMHSPKTFQPTKRTSDFNLFENEEVSPPKKHSLKTNSN
ncbi:unnamed protein product [Dimorphilus gyrociliatus]|uniref:Uncharacterized protein n=1 Tax=Dimorphilus gyrociliatus TaxID=2664684 RepID=A0A7I8WFG5_9ANNE|nr:unnamed protein product [Dimorphilus gyrociliatus]